MDLSWSAIWPSIVAGILFAVGLLMLVSRNWRWLLGGLAVVYAGATALIALSWPWTLAATVLVGGWMAASVLGLSQWNVTTEDEPERPSAWVFRLLAGLLVLPLVLSLTPMMQTWFPVDRPRLGASLALMTLGMWQLGLRGQRPLWVIGALLTVMAGFDILYAALEQSLLLAGLLALVVVALALVGGYLVIQEQEASSEEALP
ncbi:MAG: hypothetical protein GXO56_05905 [Chloroflexi bacterium]|nr:hypothetical protein [Chloroflexota bacterium]